MKVAHLSPTLQFMGLYSLWSCLTVQSMGLYSPWPCPTVQSMGLYSPWPCPTVQSMGLYSPGHVRLYSPWDYIVYDHVQLYSPWDSSGQNAGVGCLSLLQGIFPTQGSNPGLLHCRWILYQLSHEGSTRILEWVTYAFSNGSSQPRN